MVLQFPSNINQYKFSGFAKKETTEISHFDVLPDEETITRKKIGPG
jgi:hypothetical protein